MYKKIAKIGGMVVVGLLALLAIGFSAYGLYQGTSVAKLLNQETGKQIAFQYVDANFICQPKPIEKVEEVEETE